MPKHWIVALVVVAAVFAGVVAYAVVSGDDEGLSTTSVVSATSDSTAVASSSQTTSGSSTTTDPFGAASTDGPDTSGGGSSTTAGATSTSSVPCPAPSGSTEPIDTGLAGEVLLLDSVDLAAVDRCTDAVEFGFRDAGGEEPGVKVAYGEPPFVEDGTGAPVDVGGSAFVELTFEPATNFDFLSGEPTYTGPHELIASDTRYVREVALAGAFEGTVRWIVGLEEQRPFNLEVAPGRATLLFD